MMYNSSQAEFRPQSCLTEVHNMFYNWDVAYADDESKHGRIECECEYEWQGAENRHVHVQMRISGVT